MKNLAWQCCSKLSLCGTIELREGQLSSTSHPGAVEITSSIPRHSDGLFDCGMSSVRRCLLKIKEDAFCKAPC